FAWRSASLTACGYHTIAGPGNVSDELTSPWNAKAAKAAKKSCLYFASFATSALIVSYSSQPSGEIARLISGPDAHWPGVCARRHRSAGALGGRRRHHSRARGRSPVRSGERRSMAAHYRDRRVRAAGAAGRRSTEPANRVSRGLRFGNAV